MTIPTFIAALYLAQLWLKAGLALRQRGRELTPKPSDLRRLTVVQPVTSGDEKLKSILIENLRTLRGASIIWIIDQTDLEARSLCQALKAERPDQRITLIETEEPPAGFNPKMWKQAAALPLVETELLAVIDDDTCAPPRSVDCLIGMLDSGADIATGLPSYIPARGAWSLLVAEFVNSAAILTYLSAAACMEPLSINGMCYAMRTSYVRDNNLFTVCGRAITDDLAIAKEVRRLNGRIVQTTQPQYISTSVASATHYGRLMHRWFVFSRILVQNEPFRYQALLVLSYGLHPLLLAVLCVASVAQPAIAIWPLLIVLAVRATTLTLLNRRFTGSWRHAPLASVAAELLQPAFLIGAFVHPVIWWRRRKILVRKFNDFEYLSS
jgi:ceramide glucosyltransferase